MVSGVAVKRLKLAPCEFGRRAAQCSRRSMLVLWFAGRDGDEIQRLTVKEAGWDETGGVVCRAVGGLTCPFAEVRTGTAGGQILWDPGPCTHSSRPPTGSSHWAVGRLRLHKVLIEWSRHGS